MVKVKVENLNKIIVEELRLYAKEVTEDVDKTAKASMDKLVELTKHDAPEGHRQKHFKDFITSKKINEGRYLWYVKAPEYRLTHLLENGHAVWNGQRAKAHHFIEPNNQKVQKEYEEEIKKVIKNAN